MHCKKYSTKEIGWRIILFMVLYNLYLICCFFYVFYVLIQPTYRQNKKIKWMLGWNERAVLASFGVYGARPFQVGQKLKEKANNLTDKEIEEFREK